MAKPKLTSVPMPQFDVGGVAALGAEFKQRADKMPAKFLKCYVEMRHKWSDDLWRYPALGGYTVHKDCERCGMAIEITYESGLVTNRRYVKPEGRDEYGFPGMGYRSEAERAYLNLSWLSLIPIRQVLTA